MVLNRFLNRALLYLGKGVVYRFDLYDTTLVASPVNITGRLNGVPWVEFCVSRLMLSARDAWARAQHVVESITKD